MIDLKNYIYVTVIMLCFVFYGTSAVGGNCCCGSKKPNYCALCMVEVSKGDIFCEECLAICSEAEIEAKIEAPYYIDDEADESISSIPKVLVECKEESKVATPSTPLLSKPTKKMEHHTPMVKLTAEPQSVRCLSQWLTPVGAERIIGHFVTGRKECTQESLMEFIKVNLPKRLEKRSAFAQTIIMGFHVMAAHRGLATRKVKRMPRELLEQSWHGRLTDLTYRSFLVRIRLLTGKRGAVDPKILTTWETGRIPLDGYEQTLIKIMYESALGWPAFATLREADDYKRLMPDTHRIIAIFKEGVREAIGYVVGVHPGGSHIVIVEL